MSMAMVNVFVGCICDSWVLEKYLQDYLDATFAKFLGGPRFPKSLVFAQEPALDVEWTETKEMVIK